MSQINVNRIKDSNKGAPDFPSGVNVGGITSTVTLGVTNLNPTNVNVSGVVTATTLDGNLLATGTPTLGLGVTINTSGVNISGVATAGIVSATTLYGNGANITGIALSIAPLNYNPAVGGLAVGSGTGIGITFNQAVKAGSGNVTLSIANAGVAGTVVENFGVGSSVTISENRVTIDPTADLSVGQDYIISYPSGCFTNNEGTDYVGTAYTFQARTYSYQLWSWARNNEGQLGQNNRVNYSSAIQIPGTNWNNISSGGDNGYEIGAVKNDGTLWTWGENEYGVLGLNSALPSNNGVSSPTQVGSDTTWSANVRIGWGPSNASAAVKTDGTLWTWGRNFRGILGQNTSVNSHKSSPTQVGSGTDWSTNPDAVRGGGQRMIAIKDDGTMYGWGYGAYGNWGLNITGTTYYSSPVQIPGTTWSTISISNYFTNAIKTDGTLWGWGYPGYGNVGPSYVPNTPGVSAPIQIPGTWATGDNKLATSAYVTLAIKANGELWSWGYGNYGVTGQNNETKYSSPVQIPGTTSVSYTHLTLPTKRIV